MLLAGNSLSLVTHVFVNELSDNPDQPTVEHFQMLRRQWASKAQLLMATLDELPDADSAAVQGKQYRKQNLYAFDEHVPRSSRGKFRLRYKNPEVRKVNF